MRLRQSAKVSGPLGAGRRDRWVTIQARPEDSTADSGFPVDGAWTDLVTVAMVREDMDAAELQRANQQQAIATTRWEMAYRADCDPERLDIPKLRRLLYRDRTYDILAAVPIGRRQAIALVTESFAKIPSESSAAAGGGR